jgi:hypothetical protein
LEAKLPFLTTIANIKKITILQVKNIKIWSVWGKNSFKITTLNRLIVNNNLDNYDITHQLT